MGLSTTVGLGNDHLGSAVSDGSGLSAPLVSEDSVPFISKWKTDNAGTSASDQIQFPLISGSGGAYNFSVKYQGSVLKIINDSSDNVVTFADGAGTKEIEIFGQLEGWSFNAADDRLKITEISQLGDDFRLGATDAFFDGCANLTFTNDSTDILDLSGTTSLRRAFFGCSAIVTIPGINSWDTSSITSLERTFRNCTLFNSAIGSWDTSSVTTLVQMFTAASAFNQAIGSWNVGSVTAMSSVFNAATSFNQDISSWNVSNVTLMDGLFLSAVVFNQDITSWVVSSVTTMAGMFRNADAFDRAIGVWNIGSVTSLNSTFRDNNGFDQDLASWDVTSVTDAADMFLNVALSTANYSALLIGWEPQSLQSSVSLGGGNSTYSAGAAATARADIITNFSWTITDGGQA